VYNTENGTVSCPDGQGGFYLVEVGPDDDLALVVQNMGRFHNAVKNRYLQFPGFLFWFSDEYDLDVETKNGLETRQ
ncbi:hypothetical protein DRH14_03225, partial [Candidatus Shapirobacteria bacterium]